MALFKVDFTAEGRMQYVFVEGASEDAARMAVEEFAVEVTGIRYQPLSSTYQSDSGSLMVEAGQPGAEDGVDVEYGFIGHSQGNGAIYGSESAQTLLEDAGVSEGYADKERGGLDEDDLARIANALRLAFDTGLHNAGKVHDRDMAEIMRGMAKSYGQTLSKVERMLDAE